MNKTNFMVLDTHKETVLDIQVVEHDDLLYYPVNMFSF